MTTKDIYKVSNEEFISAAMSSTNIHQALLKLGMNSKGRAYDVFRNRCKKLNLDILYISKTSFKGKYSKIRDKITDNQVIESCAEFKSRRQVLYAVGLNEGGSNIRWVNKKIKELNIDTSHWLGCAHLRGKSHNWSKKNPLEQILVKDSAYNNTDSLKLRLLKEGVLKYKCSECHIDEWNNKPLSLQLEHKSGINTDNRIENLCLLCPNCHSQTLTYAGRAGKLRDIKRELYDHKNKEVVEKGYCLPDELRKKSKRADKPNKPCVDCGKMIYYKSTRCKSCAGRKSNPDKIQWPSNEKLLQMVKDSNYTKVAKELGVSDNAVRKRLKKRGLI